MEQPLDMVINYIIIALVPALLGAAYSHNHVIMAAVIVTPALLIVLAVLNNLCDKVAAPGWFVQELRRRYTVPAFVSAAARLGAAYSNCIVKASAVIDIAVAVMLVAEELAERGQPSMGTYITTAVGAAILGAASSAGIVTKKTVIVTVAIVAVGKYSQSSSRVEANRTQQLAGGGCPQHDSVQHGVVYGQPSEAQPADAIVSVKCSSKAAGTGRARGCSAKNSFAELYSVLLNKTE